MISRDNHLWLGLWRKRQTDFHQQAVNQLLIRFWPSLDLVVGSRIFVPLCGKSLDMIWLSKQGHQVVGVELSPIAVRAFFRENHLQPTRRKMGPFTLWKHGNISIFCGDYFALSEAMLGKIDMVYDRAALTALPQDLRKHYVAHLQQIASQSANIFLLTTEEAGENEAHYHALGIDEEIAALFSGIFSIKLSHVESVFENNTEDPGLPPRQSDYKVYRLTARQHDT